MPSEDIQKILKLFKAGDGTIKYVCDNFHRPIGWYSIKDVLTNNGIQYKNPRAVIDRVKEEKIKSLINSGESYSSISKRLGIKYITVSKFCKKNKIAPIKHANAIDERLYIENIKELANSGYSRTYIAKKIGLCRKTIQRICENNSIDVTDKKAYPLDKAKIISKIEEIGYKVIDIGKKNNKNNVTSIHLECGNERNTYYQDYFKHSCKYCSYTGTSKGELEVKQWIKDLGFDSEKVKIENKEIDMLISLSDKKIGIEYCGLYWHSEKFDTNRYKHKDKMDLCNKNDIRLLTVFEDEWVNSKKQVKNFIKSVLNVKKEVIFGRKCTVKEVPKKIAANFLDDNHIQKKTIISIAYGLYDSNYRLLGVVTGNKHHRQGNKRKLVLNRLAFLDGVQVIGGASKLLKHLIKYAKENEYDTIISWSDNRWSEGNVYKKCGFTLEEELIPDYSYSTGGIVRISKQSCQKRNLIKKGGFGDTEKEMAESLGYYRIWDCGKKDGLYIYKKELICLL